MEECGNKYKIAVNDMIGEYRKRSVFSQMLFLGIPEEWQGEGGILGIILKDEYISNRWWGIPLRHSRLSSGTNKSVYKSSNPGEVH